jgi:transketolase
MRKSFKNILEKLIKNNDNLILLLCDIGVFSFNDIIKKYSKRVLNIGILEQSSVSFAAGLSLQGYIPVVHTIAPFLVNRAFEQIKLDFGYQELRGNFISVGASYDYSALGCSHHCPEDVNLMKNIPNMQIFIPGTGKEFEELFKQNFRKIKPNYFRLSSEENSRTYNISAGRANLIKEGKEITIIAVGPVLNYLKTFINKINCNILYYTSIRPFDYALLKKFKKRTKKIIIIEPLYEGSVTEDVLKIFRKKKVIIETINIPKTFIRKYGEKKEIDNYIDFTEKKIKNKIMNFIKNA